MKIELGCLLRMLHCVKSLTGLSNPSLLFAAVVSEFYYFRAMLLIARPSFQVSDSFFEGILVERSGDGGVVKLTRHDSLACVRIVMALATEAPAGREVYEQTQDLPSAFGTNAERDIFAIYFDRGHLETTSNQFSRKSTLARGQVG